MKSDRTTDTRDHLLATGADIILGKGFAAAGLSEILGAAGVPKGSFYHYFESKEGYGVALLERYFEASLSRIDQLLADRELDGRAKLDVYFDAWHPEHGAAENETSCSSRCLAVKLSGEVSDLSDDMRRALEYGMARIIERLAAIILIGRADGSIGPGEDAGQLAAALYQLWLGAALVGKVRHSTQPYAIARSGTAALLKPKET
ncbi:MAG TPA: TetR/AcrR family transcriptional regulator [Chitinolyticbacter sp.]|nr:TetR/AcrR family transcriptional regulator [Chitinolyticbacter sp.]